MPRHLDKTEELLDTGRFATKEELAQLEKQLNGTETGHEREAALQTITDRVRVANTLKKRANQPSLNS